MAVDKLILREKVTRRLELEIDGKSCFLTINVADIDAYEDCLEYHDGIRTRSRELEELYASASIPDEERGRMVFKLIADITKLAKKVACSCLIPDGFVWEDIEKQISINGWTQIAAWCIDAYASYLRTGANV